MTTRLLIAIWIDEGAALPEVTGFSGGDIGIAHVERALRAAGLDCETVGFTSGVERGSTEDEIEALDALSVTLEIEADEKRKGW